MHTCWICSKPCLSTNTICKCKNEISYVHNECVIKWIAISGNSKCQFCNSNYIFSTKDSMYYFLLKVKYLFCKFCYEMTELSEFMLENHLIF